MTIFQQRYLNEIPLNQVYFDDLNFHNLKDVCAGDYIYRKKVIAILKTPNASRLQKLAINNCILCGKLFTKM